MPNESKFSKSLKAGGKTYFFDVNTPKSGSGGDYLKVTESGLRQGQQARSSITVFSDHLKDFFKAIEEVKTKMNI